MLLYSAPYPPVRGWDIVIKIFMKKKKNIKKKDGFLKRIKNPAKTLLKKIIKK